MTPNDMQPDPVKSRLQRIRSRLEDERDRICAEIRRYPTPIPRCDAQFNHLIEQRDSIVRELQRIEDMAASAADDARIIDAVIEQSSLDDAVKRELCQITRGPDAEASR